MVIANSQKFKTILISKIKNAIPEKQTMQLMMQKTNQRIQYKFFGITIDKLNFECHINSICKSVKCQMNVLFRLKSLTKSFV